jgi:hypothetical protein
MANEVAPTFVIRAPSDIRSVAICTPPGLANSANMFIVCGDFDGNILVYSAQTRRLVTSVDHAHGAAILSISTLSPDSRLVVAASRDGSVSIWKWDDGFSKLLPYGRFETRCTSFCKVGALLLSSHKTDSPPNEGRSAEYQLCVASATQDPSQVVIFSLRCPTDLQESPITVEVLSQLLPANESAENRIGMCMQVSLHASSADSKDILAIASFEDGSVCGWQCHVGSHAIPGAFERSRPIFSVKCHGESGLCHAPYFQYGKDLLGYILAGSAENSLAILEVGRPEKNASRCQVAGRIPIPNPGAQEISIRHDGKICAIGGWDGKCVFRGLLRDLFSRPDRAL